MSDYTNVMKMNIASNLSRGFLIHSGHFNIFSKAAKVVLSYGMPYSEIEDSFHTTNDAELSYFLSVNFKSTMLFRFEFLKYYYSLFIL